MCRMSALLNETTDARVRIWLLTSMFLFCIIKRSYKILQCGLFQASYFHYLVSAGSVTFWRLNPELAVIG